MGCLQSSLTISRQWSENTNWGGLPELESAKPSAALRGYQFPRFIVKVKLNKQKLEADWLPCWAAPDTECSSFRKSPQSILHLSESYKEFLALQTLHSLSQRLLSLAPRGCRVQSATHLQPYSFTGIRKNPFANLLVKYDVLVPLNQDFYLPITVVYIALSI